MLSKDELGNYLKKIRNNKGLSLRKVNQLTDISYSHLNMIENGKRNVTPALLRVLADLYNVDYLDLYEKAGYIDLINDEFKESNISTLSELNIKIQSNYGDGSIELLACYAQLNESGQTKALENIHDLAKIPEYTEKKNALQSNK